MHKGLATLGFLLVMTLAPVAWAEDPSFVAGDGTRFTLPAVDGLPGRAENEVAVFESAGFDTDTTGAPVLTDRFAFLFKGGNPPVRLRVEDVTLAMPVLIVEAAVPEDLPGAGFRRSRFEVRAAPCAIARGEPCSAWMFADQPYRIYRATMTYGNGDTVSLLQAEPYQMTSFISRLGDRIPNRESAPQTAQSEKP